MTDKKEVRKVNTDEIEGEYILKNTGPDKKAIKSYMVPDKKKIIYSTVIWYDPETGKYYFKSESDMGGDTLAGQIVSHKLIQDLLNISKWILKSDGKLWDDGIRVSSGGFDRKAGFQPGVLDMDGTVTPPKKVVQKNARKGWLKGTPAQRAEHAKKLAAIKREGCCPRCHRRITPESQSTFDEHYLCKWCDQKRSNCKEGEYSDHTKEDSK